MSKRTVYDHFGDKERQYAAVVTAATVGLLASSRAAIDEDLPEGCDPGTALLGFARHVATETFGSSKYA